MRLLVTILILIVSTSLFLGGCGGPPPSQERRGGNTGVNPALSRVVLEVPTIWCSSCQPRVEANAKGVPGVKALEFDNQTVIVTYDPKQTAPDAIVRAIEKGGDKVTRITQL